MSTTVKKGVMYLDEANTQGFYPQTTTDMVKDETTGLTVKEFIDSKQSKVLYGTTAPTSDVGKDGDIYILIG